MLDGIVVRLRETHFKQSVRGYSFVPHRLKQGLITDHNTNSLTDPIIFWRYGIGYLRYKTYNARQFLAKAELSEDKLKPQTYMGLGLCCWYTLYG